MITRKQKELLMDLVKLFDKHGTQPFEELAELLSSPETIELWVNFLRQSSTAARKAGFEQNGKRRGGPRRAVKSELERIKSEDPEKHQALASFRDVLLSKTILPQLKDVRNFAQTRGLPAITARSREQAIFLLLQSMIALDTNVINKIIESLPSSPTETVNDLEEWTRIIMAEKRK